MSESGSTEDAPFHRDAYATSERGMGSLFQSLPARDVRAVAEEALRRIAERAEGARIGAVAERDQVEELCTALMSEDAMAGARFVEGLAARGIGTEEICLGYLTPAARRFDEMWRDDKASVLAVSTAAGRIVSILRAQRSESVPAAQTGARAALFAPVPGEEHLLGVRMAAELFWQRGWQVELALEGDHDALVAHVARAGHRRIGLSASGAHSAPALARLIVALRVVDPGCFVLVSGRIVSEAPDLVSAAMPDAIAADIETAEAALSSA